MVDLDEQEGEITPWRSFADVVGRELISNLPTDCIVMVKWVPVCCPEKDEIGHTPQKAAQEEPNPPWSPASLECNEKYKDQPENNHFFLNPKNPPCQQPGQEK